MKYRKRGVRGPPFIIENLREVKYLCIARLLMFGVGVDCSLKKTIMIILREKVGIRRKIAHGGFNCINY
jgi:hypothetical protein